MLTVKQAITDHRLYRLPAKIDLVDQTNQLIEAFFKEEFIRSNKLH